jgi:hypothetical protein
VTASFYRTKPYYDLIISSDLGATPIPGRGINMTEPDSPRPSTHVAFRNEEKTLFTENILKHAMSFRDSPLSFSTNFVEEKDYFEEAKILHAYFRASLGFGSVRAAYNSIRNETTARKTVYVLMNNIGAVNSIEPDTVRWSENEPDAESIVNEFDRIEQFVQDYGTHYIQSVTLGFRIAVRGSAATSNISEQEEFSGAIKGAFASLSVGGGVSSTHRAIIARSNVQVQTEITAGRTEPTTPIVLTSLDDVSDFIEKLRSGEVKIFPAPLKANLQSFWHTFSHVRHPRLKNDFLPDRAFVGDASSFGVPAGTIIAWFPTRADLHPAIGMNGSLVAPQGWTICDGATEGVPDLRDKFIFGTVDSNEVGKTGGSPDRSHSHSGSTSVGGTSTAERGGGHHVADAYHTHSFTTSTVEHFPPYYKLVYIMKLRV